MGSLQARIDKKYVQQNRLFGVLLELTHRCPCDCEHCLLIRKPEDELSLGELGELFKQLKDIGVFNLGLTGGEPFLRNDIFEILELARKDQFLVTILTTGVLIKKDEARRLKELGITSLEISLLGAKAETHDSIMRFPGAFDRMMAAVGFLKEEDLTVRFKSTLMLPNWKELSDMIQIAKDANCPISTSISVSPRVDGDLSPLSMALTRDEICQLDQAGVYGGIMPGEEHNTGAVLTCRAGKTVGAISPKGDVYPCIILRNSIGNIRDESLASLWNKHSQPGLMELRSLKKEDVVDCLKCEIRRYCQRCPGIAELETGTLTGAPLSSCELAIGMAMRDKKISGAFKTPPQTKKN